MRDIYESAVAFMLPVKSHYVDRNVIKLHSFGVTFEKGSNNTGVDFDGTYNT